MCGIGGFQTSVPRAAENYLAAVLVRQHHRGPDGRGDWESADQLTGLCHNRLAILDLSPAGAQPMHAADSQLTIVFNGEIYNWRELRTELQQYGYAFKSSSDTEVLLAAYQQWGKSLLSKLRGMFAFAIYDHATRELFLARDRVGKKPVVYAELSAGFFFASELPALRAAPDGDAALNLNAIATGLVHNLQHIPEPHTPYQNFHKLRAGHAMTVLGGKITNTWRYYDPLAGDAAPTTAAQLRELLEDSVACRMAADVPVAALLSGGVDSSAICAIMQAHRQTPVQTYALGLDADDEDLRRARVMAARIGSQHREFYFDPQRQWDVLGDLLRQYGEPISLLPLVHAAELFRHIRADGSRVVLAGHGADELFYGYTGHWRTLMVSLLLQYGGGVGRCVPQKFLSPKWHALFHAHPGARKAALYTVHAQRFAGQVLRSDWAAHFKECASPEMAYWGALLPNHDYLDESNFAGLMVENQHSITIAGDLPAMMHGIEARCPFLDQRIMQFAWRTPWWKKLVPGKYHQQKYILRQAVADIVPPDLLNAPKRGFGSGIPLHALLTHHWRAQAEAYLFAPSAADAIIDQKKIMRLWQQCLDGSAPAASLLFKVLVLQRWLAES